MRIVEDAHQRLYEDSEICFGVLGRNGDFVLIDMALPLDENVTAEALAKGYAYCGVVAVKNGVYGAKCAPDPDSIFTMLQAAIAAAPLVADRLRHPEKGDGVLWLRQLYALPDLRA